MRKRLFLISSVVALAAACFALCGCSADKGDPNVTLNPTVSSPTIIQDGVLSVGVDTTYAPFAIESEGQIVGIDVDVAAAVADQLGLELKLVDLAGQNANDALANNEVDIVMNLERLAGSKTSALKAAAYIYDGPALFQLNAEEGATVDINTLDDASISAQSTSLAASTIQDMYPNNKNIQILSTLTDVMDALTSGQVTYSAADLVVGSYAALSRDGVSYVASLATPEPIYIGVLSTNNSLGTAVAGAVETLEQEGVLEMVLAKWMGSHSANIALPSVGSAINVEVKSTKKAEAEEEEEENEEEGAENSDDEEY